MPENNPQEKLNFTYPAQRTLCLVLSGNWQIASITPSLDQAISELKAHPEVTNITFESSQIGDWDTGLAAFLLKLAKECERRNIRLSPEGLPQGAQKLLTLAQTVQEKEAPAPKIQEPFLARVGDTAVKVWSEIKSLLDFLGELLVSFARLLKGKAYIRRKDFKAIIQACGAEAFPLVSLISVLLGLILAFVGAMQLRMFGAQIFVADIVGIAMVRVMGAIMTGIIMTGRTGASFAAELGIMQTNEEIDALRTLGIPPMDFLILPRVLALVLMMPLLTLYSNLMGILGGYIIGVGMLELNPVEYFNRTQEAIGINNLWVGMVHSVVFGVIIAVSGCFRGIQCGRSAAAVGEATTSAVVTGITSIVVATAIITYICQLLGV